MRVPKVVQGLGALLVTALFVFALHVQFGLGGSGVDWLFNDFVYNGLMVGAAKLDNRPALDVCLSGLDAPPEAREDPAALTRFALTHPLGLARRSGEDHVRFIGEADFAERALVCIAEVPQGGMAWFMEGDDHSALAATDAACADALAALGDAPPRGLLAFDCIARKGILGEVGIQAELERVASHANGAPVAGFYTYGEIARTRGVSGFHNQTLVVLAVA